MFSNYIMESVEAKYLSVKDKIKSLRDEISDYRDVLNKTANILLNVNDEYEFQTTNLVISKPSNHTAKKKKT